MHLPEDYAERVYSGVLGEIINTAGWDTDCNSGNLGCLLFEHGNDWQTPIADRIFMPTADSGTGFPEAGKVHSNSHGG